MPTLDIAGKTVQVHDDFLKLSPDKQNDVVAQIASSLGIKSGDKGADATGSPIKDQATDIVRSAGGGLIRGAAGLVGSITGTIPDLIVGGVDRAQQYIRGETAAERDARIAERRKDVTFPNAAENLSPGGIQKGIEKVTGEAYEPQTTAGKFASTAAEFVPGGAIGRVPNILRNAITYGVIPGLVSEGAGQAFKGSPAEPYARIAGAIAAGVGGASAQRLGSADKLVKSATEGVTHAQIDQAEALFTQAQRAGIPISQAEALQAVTNGATGLGDLQHTVEGMGGMKDFYANRPAQNEAAAQRTFDTVAPPHPDPSQIGPAAGAAGENIVTRVRGAINQATRPMYDAAGQHLVPAQLHAANMADPLFAETLNTIRNDPARNAMVSGLSDRNVLMYNEIGKELEQRSRNASQPLNPQANQQIAAVTGRLGSDVKDMGIVGERASANGPSSLEAALATQARLRQQYLQPVLNGPIGKLAGQDTTTKSAIDALFPTKPLANSQDEIGQAVRALSRQRPGVANDLVRAHAEATFDQAAKRLASGGPNQSGGAKFAAALRGNGQQAANLEAAIRALPNGDATWHGFNQFLDVMEAQQMRQATGSRTAFKIPGVEDLKTGGIANTAAQIVGGGGVKLPQKVMSAIQNWNVGRNLDRLADLLTNPASAEDFRRIATLPRQSVQSTALIGRLVSLADRSQPTRVINPDRDGR